MRKVPADGHVVSERNSRSMEEEKMPTCNLQRCSRPSSSKLDTTGAFGSSDRAEEAQVGNIWLCRRSDQAQARNVGHVRHIWLTSRISAFLLPMWTLMTLPFICLLWHAATASSADRAS